MKEHWEKYWETLERMDKTFEHFLQNGSLSVISANKIKAVVKAWNAQKTAAAEMDSYIQPIDELPVKMPFGGENQAFNAMWIRWKEYLQEQHAQLIRSRAEVSALEHLEKISNKDAEKAIYILRFAMAGRYKNFFYVDEVTATTEAKQSQSDFD